MSLQVETMQKIYKERDKYYIEQFIKFYKINNKDDFFMNSSSTLLGYYYSDIIENKNGCQEIILEYIIRYIKTKGGLTNGNTTNSN